MGPIYCFKVPHDTSLRPMEIGDLVIYRGRAYVLRGLDPMSVDARRAHLEDASTGERLWADLEELEEPPPPEA
jgi:hypothetical protein